MNDLFFQKLQNAVQSRATATLVLLSPGFERMPLPLQRYDEPFLPFGKAIIDATHDLTAGYVFDLEAYLLPGAAGIIALERTISYVPSELVTVLHGTFLTTVMTSGIRLSMNSDSVTVGRRALIDAQPRELRSRLLLVDDLEEPDTGTYSRFNCEQGVIIVRDGDRQSIQLYIAGADVTQAGMGEDFSDIVRKTLQGKIAARHV